MSKEINTLSNSLEIITKSLTGLLKQKGIIEQQLLDEARAKETKEETYDEQERSVHEAEKTYFICRECRKEVGTIALDTSIRDHLVEEHFEAVTRDKNLNKNLDQEERNRVAYISLNGIMTPNKGLKFDQEKPIAGALIDFKLALAEVSKLLTLGAKKYERSSWLAVDNAEQRYYDGLWRHLLEIDNVEGNLGHDVAVVFNALAVLELRLQREERLRYESRDAEDLPIRDRFCKGCNNLPNKTNQECHDCSYK